MSNILDIAKNLGLQQNVSIRVIDEITGKVVSEHSGHNAATATLLTGIGHFLMGEALASGASVLSDWIPQYISLGTMGLNAQEAVTDPESEYYGLPTEGSIGNPIYTDTAARYADYLNKCPGFGADGYDPQLNNDRKFLGLGPSFKSKLRPDPTRTIDCELISNSFHRSKISYRRVLPESQSEIPKTIDVVFSSMITTGALRQFREPGKDYLFISEVGLWSSPGLDVDEEEDSQLGLGFLAGYRLAPPDKANWDMNDPLNQTKLRENIIRVGINQVVQVIWKIQIGAVEQMSGGDLQWFEYV